MLTGSFLFAPERQVINHNPHTPIFYCTVFPRLGVRSLGRGGIPLAKKHGVTPESSFVADAAVSVETPLKLASA
jgi:hypothetical protein